MPYIVCDFMLLQGWKESEDSYNERGASITPWEEVDKGILGKWHWWNGNRTDLYIRWPGTPDWHYNLSATPGHYNYRPSDGIEDYIAGYSFPLSSFFDNIVCPSDWTSGAKDVWYREQYHYLGDSCNSNPGGNNNHIDAIEITRYNFSEENQWKKIDSMFLSRDDDANYARSLRLLESNGLVDKKFLLVSSEEKKWNALNALHFDLNHPNWKNVEGIGMRLSESNDGSDIWDSTSLLTEERRFDFRFDPKIEIATPTNGNGNNCIYIPGYKDDFQSRYVALSAKLENWQDRLYDSMTSTALPQATVNDVIIKPVYIQKNTLKNAYMHINWIDNNDAISGTNIWEFYPGWPYGFPIDKMEEYIYSKKIEEKDNYYYDRRSHGLKLTDAAYDKIGILLNNDWSDKNNQQFDNFQLEFYVRDTSHYEGLFVKDDPLDYSATAAGEYVKIYNEKLIKVSDNISIITGEGFSEGDLGGNYSGTFADKHYNYITEEQNNNIKNNIDLYLYLENIPFNFFSYDTEEITEYNIIKKYPLYKAFNNINFNKKKIEYNLSHHMSILSYPDIQSFYLIIQSRLQNYYAHLVEHDMDMVISTSANLEECNRLIQEISEKQKNIKVTKLKIEVKDINLSNTNITLFNSLKNKEITLSNDNINIINDNKLKINFNLQDHIKNDDELFVKWFLKVEPKKISFDTSSITANIGNNYILDNNIPKNIKNSSIMTDNYTYKIINKIDNKLILSENIVEEITNAYIIKNDFDPILIELDVNWQKLYIPNSAKIDLYTMPIVIAEPIDEPIDEPIEDEYSITTGNINIEEEVIW
jgi:hypothetical protein